MSLIEAPRGSSLSWLNVSLWIAQMVLAIVFLFQGVLKFAPPPGLPEALSWVYDVNGPIGILIGIAELAGAAGMILPGLTRTLPGLTPLAALGLALTMVGAVIFHFVRAELVQIPLNVILFGVAGFVAYGRWRAAPHSSRW